jgi:diphthine-ammonia ligase
MKLGILLSGGKDSLFSAYIAGKNHEISCAISIRSENKESYMFHTPNIDLVNLQAQAMNIPLILKTTQGVKEEELSDLKEALLQAKENHIIEGIVTGAVASQYQASRIQHICHELDLWCFNPLWQINQIQLLHELNKHNFDVRIIGVFGYPLDESFLGARIDENTIKKLSKLEEEFKINPAGEGGETESLVLDCPLFAKRIEILNANMQYKNYTGTYTITDARLVDKQDQEIKEIKDVELHFFENKNPDVSIISTCSLKLLEYEFIRPIVDVLCEEKKTYNIIRLGKKQDADYKHKEKKILADKIIISGTALKDNEFLKRKEGLAQELKNKKVLGICAGAEILGLFAGAQLRDIFEIGQINIEKKKEHEIFSGVKTEEFFLHQNGFFIDERALDVYLVTKKGSAGFLVPHTQWIGIQFHPELREKTILKKFIRE